MKSDFPGNAPGGNSLAHQLCGGGGMTHPHVRGTDTRQGFPVCDGDFCMPSGGVYVCVCLNGFELIAIPAGSVVT